MAGTATKTQLAHKLKLRTVSEADSFGESRAVLGVSVKRLDEVLEGAVFVVARGPEECHPIPKTNLRIIISDPFPDMPRLRIFFRIVSESECEFLWIEVASLPDEEDIPDDDLADCEE